ncbi:chitin disaccharide deacetylase [Enterococcus rivorum]|uniref:Carbohydrate deacetylase n=1 Tax=Enterococcus rivorum TaxID=762845 RepID=A0A1E5KWH5_9ENTE|nr:chitin disaccharide deacetylase [Enterococcus rivorum]MBP2100033.1 putative glycoside hydrolase/deacetylase ChbG (UPF0249 family) [Enterococcus rivorum]OEH82230.1 hypothetical protein BCR26_13795 [Enterococcus rivorum]
MKLIVNADDFGFSKGQNYGIIDSFKDGIVTATTLMNNMPDTMHAYELAKANPDLDLGVHLALDVGRPISSIELVPSLVDEDGLFKKNPLADKLNSPLNLREVYTEWKAQIDLMIDNDIQPTHIDSHHHIHMDPSLIETYLKLAKEYDLAIRFHPKELPKETIPLLNKMITDFRRADLFSSEFYLENVAVDFFYKLPLRTDKTVEIMCHPAYLDQTILTRSSYALERSIELEVLQSSEAKLILAENKVELINFKQLI